MQVLAQEDGGHLHYRALPILTEIFIGPPKFSVEQ